MARNCDCRQLTEELAHRYEQTKDILERILYQLHQHLIEGQQHGHNMRHDHLQERTHIQYI